MPNQEAVELPVYASVATAMKLAKMVDESPLVMNVSDGNVQVVVPEEPKFLSDNLAIRKWIYNIAIAALVIVAAWQTGQAVAMESWANLISMVLNLGGIGAVSLARVNAR